MKWVKVVDRFLLNAAQGIVKIFSSPFVFLFVISFAVMVISAWFSVKNYRKLAEKRFEEAKIFVVRNSMCSGFKCAFTPDGKNFYWVNVERTQMPLLKGMLVQIVNCDEYNFCKDYRIIKQTKE